MANSDAEIEQLKSDPPFDPSERLFRRISKEDVESGVVSDLSLPSPAFSVDREYYRKYPADMIAEHPGSGVAAIKVEDIPPSLVSEDGRRFDFRVEYRPLKDNPAHSEIHSYQGGIRLKDQGRKPPSAVRKIFRDLLRKKMRILDLEEEGAA